MKILKFHPFLIKPNNIELAEMFDAEIKSDEDIIFYARKLQELGARNVLVSMAKDGAILVDENGTIKLTDFCQSRELNKRTIDCLKDNFTRSSFLKFIRLLRDEDHRLFEAFLASSLPFPASSPILRTPTLGFSTPKTLSEKILPIIANCLNI